MKMKNIIKSVIGMIALAVIMFGQSLVSFGGEAPSIHLLSPNGGEIYKHGDVVHIDWVSTGIPQDAIVKVGYLTYPYEGVAQIVLVTNTGSYDWVIPATQPFGGDYLITVEYRIDPDMEGVTTADRSDSYFTIATEEIRLTISRDGVISWPIGAGGYYWVHSSTNLHDWRVEGIVTTNRCCINSDGQARFFRVVQSPLWNTTPAVMLERSSNSPSNSVLAGTVNATLLVYSSRVWDEDLEIDHLNIRADTAGRVRGGVANAKIFLNGMQVGQTQNLPEATEVEFAFGSSFLLKTGITNEVKIVGDIVPTTSGSYSGGETVTITICTGTNNALFRTSLARMSVPFMDMPGYTLNIVGGTLTAANGAMPDSAILVAGSTNNYVAQFKFSAANEGFAINKLILKIPYTSTLPLLPMTRMVVVYKDRDGLTHRDIAALTSNSAASDPTVIAWFPDGLSMYIPADEDSTFDVYIDMDSLVANGFSGAAGAISLDWDDGFSAIGDLGTVVTSAGPADLTGNTFVVRKSKPTFTVLGAGTDPVNGPLFRFSVVADSEYLFADNDNPVEIKQLGFKVCAIGCTVTGLYLYNPSTSARLTEPPIDPYQGIALVPLPVGSVLPAFTIPKTYEVRGTVTGYGQAGDSITVGFMQDANPVANGSVSEVAGSGAYNIWSDRSAPDNWSNGYLLKGMGQTQTFTR